MAVITGVSLRHAQVSASDLMHDITFFHVVIAVLFGVLGALHMDVITLGTFEREK